jgi:hypothetical protein
MTPRKRPVIVKDEAYWAHIRRVVDAWPEFTDEQVRKLNAVLWLDRTPQVAVPQRLGRAS